MRAKAGVLAILAAALIATMVPARAASGFDGSYLRPIDVAREAREEYGSSAAVTSLCDHLNCWRAKVNGQLRGLDLTRAVQSQYGSGYKLVAVGLHLYDWRAISLPRANYIVQPVIEVASDRWLDVAGVDQGLASFRSVLTTTQNWYSYRAGKTFHPLTPIVIQSDYTSQQWIDDAASTAQPCYDGNNTHWDCPRYNLLRHSQEQYLKRLPQPGTDNRLRAQLSSLAVSQYVGYAPDVWLGAADGGQFAMAPPRATSVSCPASGAQDSRCADATYAIGHELGHAFGLDHSCHAYPSDPNCGKSIMETRKPWDAILLQGEIDHLIGSSYFS